ncbi:MAG: porin [Chromatiales bacterium]|nr:porin [Chromatiales bacterium]
MFPPVRTTLVKAIAGGIALAGAQAPAFAAEDAKSFEVYGFAMLDYIQDFNRVNPDWEDALRPSRIPTDDEQFGGDGQASVSAKQSRFGVRGSVPTGKGALKARLEIDLFGVGEDAGQTTIRLRHAYGEFGQFLAGQTHSLFMDIDIFPNVIDYWGPTGMVFLRTPQIRWTPVASDGQSFAIAIERPGNDVDPGQYRTVGDIAEGLQADEEYPDFTAQYRINRDWGHFQAAGILRKVGVEVIDGGDVVYQDNDLGWGIDLTGVLNVLDRDAIRAGIVFGAGIASYMNDGGMDAGPDRALLPDGSLPGGTQVQAVDLTGVSLYYDHWWNDQWSSSVGYSFTEVDNTAGQTPDTFERGSYASGNLLYYPVKNMMVGAELLWGEREDLGGASGTDTRLQVSFKYDFGSAL